MEIVKFPHPALLKRCEEVTVFGDELKVLLQNMTLTMRAERGVGLAANQVGLQFRMFTMMRENGQLVFAVNPKIVSSSKAVSKLKEGCLSAPGEFLVTGSRAQWIQMRYQDETGREHLITLDGLDAVCAQHEIEHLDGKSFMQSKTIPKGKRQQICGRWGLKP